MGAAFAGLISGVIFGVGLVLGGMTQPSKVIGFLDITGDWDPSLAFVMGGAIAVYAPAYRLITRARVPRYARAFLLPTSLKVEPSLLLGAGIFGVGWGIGGFCPGPGIVSAGTGRAEGLTFVASMFVGMLLHEAYKHLRASTADAGDAAGGDDRPDISTGEAPAAEG